MSTSDLKWFKSSYSGSEGDSCVEVALDWNKSSYSGSEGDDCLEAARSWSKSSYSGSQGDSCVEVAPSPRAIHIRDSKDKQGPQLALAPVAWTHFLTHIGNET